MKKLYILTIAALAITSANAQVVFSSDLSDWTSGAPDDFMGSVATHTTNLTVTEITTGVVHGTSAAQLTTSGTSHRRFSTQPVSVTDQQGYEVTIYAKGQGEVRFGLYDGNTGPASGYTSYTSYQTINSTTLSTYTGEILATNTLATGEFVISVRNTVAPDHIIIDSVVISEVTIAPPSTVSVFDIQFTTAVPANSPYEGQIVNTGGIVTHVRTDNKGWYISSGTGPFSGIYVYSTLNPSPVSIGDSITLTAEVVEFNELTELSFPNNIVVVSSGNFVEATPVPTGSILTEAYEGCFISTCGLCTAADNGFGDWTINDGTGDAEVGDFFFTNTGTSGTTYNVKGIIDFAFGFFGFLPRNGSDVQSTTACAVSVSENNIVYNVYPNPTHNELNIEVEGSYNVSILDINGKVMLNQITNGFTTIDVSGLASGMYLINVEGNMTKFIKN